MYPFLRLAVGPALLCAAFATQAGSYMIPKIVPEPPKAVSAPPAAVYAPPAPPVYYYPAPPPTPLGYEEGYQRGYQDAEKALEKPHFECCGGRSNQ